ncbi:hypothetical protein NDU88_005936 [Pleurodeles waltl]|uniref:Uncharacterized protein n=1 Tax=Pleurodeles waltl TaxID=8319 RepID=A0AAV7QJD7_PLEWA|nr:hypothetical protein NDU88_005936 [Pleurodeles waltl]
MMGSASHKIQLLVDTELIGQPCKQWHPSRQSVDERRHNPDNSDEEEEVAPILCPSTWLSSLSQDLQVTIALGFDTKPPWSKVAAEDSSTHVLNSLLGGDDLSHLINQLEEEELRGQLSVKAVALAEGEELRCSGPISARNGRLIGVKLSTNKRSQMNVNRPKN